jgi:VanZ family protein
MARLRLPLLPRWLRAVAVVAVAATIAYFSLQDTVRRPSAGPFWDKQVHFLGYAGFTLVAAYATAHLRDRPYRRALLVVVSVVCYGVLMELLQAPIPGRQFSVLDMLANTAGTLLVSAWFVVERRVRYRRVGVGESITD